MTPNPSRPARHHRGPGVRARATLVSVLVVAVVLILGAWAFMVLTQNRIEQSIRDAAATRAETIVELIQTGTLADPLPGRDPNLLAQVVDASGVVIAADRAVGDVAPFAGPGVAEGEGAAAVNNLFGENEGDVDDRSPYWVIARHADTAEGPVRVLVAASLEQAVEALNAAAPLLGVGLPVILAVVALTTWLLTGLALRPVESMRTQAEQISAVALDRRLPVPRSRDEIHRLALTLNDMLERLETSTRRHRRFIADASHELKSPLATLRAILDVTAGGPASEPRPEVLADLSHEVGRMQGLVSDLLYLAERDEARPGAPLREVDLDQVAGRAAGLLAHRTPLTINTSGLEPARILGDADQVSRLVGNLLDNAARHARSCIWLETTTRGGEAVLVVSDDGPGIPSGEEERIFERFVRLDESRARDTGGSGLGLAVARAIARSHRGDLRSVPSGHGGASFEARFPLAGHGMPTTPA
ncbi:MAG: HAMP domain-containing histidine kinase [Acidimicrobiia bacterium]|nr:HAMP domain-containing histidine kinase [Acidimicrobiia bacterium]